MFATPAVIQGSKWEDENGNKYVVACVGFDRYLLICTDDWNRYYDDSMSLEVLAKFMNDDGYTTYKPL